MGAVVRLGGGGGGLVGGSWEGGKGVEVRECLDDADDAGRNILACRGEVFSEFFFLFGRGEAAPDGQVEGVFVVVVEELFDGDASMLEHSCGIAIERIKRSVADDFHAVYMACRRT